jgi:UDP-2,3-diacylglucosamine pyrophosphatase LpxH
MRALAISDLHFGAWTGDPVLVREFALNRLEPHLEDIDELILLGDVFDLLFSTVEHAFAQADAFFSLLQRKLQGRRVVYLAGNHDHHIVIRTLRSYVETKVATGAQEEELAAIFESEYRDFFQRFLDRRLEGVETEMVYPTHRVGDVLLSHGHYLDAHMLGSLPNRILNRATWTIAGGRPAATISIEDYESVITPLTELLFTVAQMPRGCGAQRSFHQQFERIGRVLRLGAEVEARLRRARSWATRRRNGAAAGHVDAVSADDDPADAWHHRGRRLERASSPADPVRLALAAHAEVVRNLGWARDGDKLVYAHTHQPLDGVTADVGSAAVRFWNTGSWLYEPALGSYDDYRSYLERAWPGTAVVIDTTASEPQLIELLADQNPLDGGQPRRGELLRGEDDMFTERGGRYAARARLQAGRPTAP